MAHGTEHFQAKSHGQLERGLGWFSIGLGLAEILAPRTVSDLAGLDSHPLLIRSLGLREVGSGIAILANPQPTAAVWSRVAGDLMDLSLLGVGLLGAGTNRKKGVATALAVAGVTALDIASGMRLLRESGVINEEGGVSARRSITVNRARDELYRFWRRFENLPRVMSHVESVTETGKKTSRWRAKGPAGSVIEWDAEVTKEIPGKEISWRSTANKDFQHRGSITFTDAPGNRGTEVRVEIDYKPVGGVMGAALAALFGKSPSQEIGKDLRRFRQLMETGEITLSGGSPAGKGLGRGVDEAVEQGLS